MLVRDVATPMSVACWHAGVDRGSGASNNVCGVDAGLLTLFTRVPLIGK